MDLNPEELENFQEFIDTYKWRVSDHVIERNGNIIANFECSSLTGENLQNILKRARQTAFSHFGKRRFSCLISIGRYLGQYNTDKVLTFRLFTSGLNTVINQPNKSFVTTVETFYQDCEKQCNFSETFLSQSFFPDQNSNYQFIQLSNIEFLFFQSP